jgi:predicted phage terminase large subunit-like protein
MEARTSLEAFAKYTFQANPRKGITGYVCEPFHAKICEHFDQVLAGRIKRLMVIAPPQHGKSEIASVRFPAYCLCKNPNDPFILVSYAAEPAERKSREARAIVESAENKKLFPNVTTWRESRAVNRWMLRKPYRGYMLAVGVGGPITGEGAPIAVIDDPIENWEKAQSRHERDKAWDWYRTVFRNRIWADGRIVVVQTRWHEDDLCGRLLNEQDHEWTVLRIPAIAETSEERASAAAFLKIPCDSADPIGRSPGEPCCPKRFPLRSLESLRKDVGIIAWNAQYQGCPRPPDGNRIKRNWIQILPPYEPIMSPNYHLQPFVRAWDKASSKDSGDFTVGILMTRDPKTKQFIIESVVRGQWSPAERDQVILNTSNKDRSSFPNYHITIEQEPGSAGADSARATTQLLASFHLTFNRPSGSKETRAEPLAIQAENGFLAIRNQSFTSAFIDELVSFPSGKHDDQVDAAAAALNHLCRLPTFTGKPFQTTKGALSRF